MRKAVWWVSAGVLCVMTVTGLASFVAAESWGQGPLDSGYRINVNQEDAATLQLLPGIGPSIARNIVTQREQGGLFVEPADLQSVHMIGPVLSERISPWIVFDIASPER